VDVVTAAEEGMALAEAADATVTEAPISKTE
jgi:hypothetical protein